MEKPDISSSFDPSDIELTKPNSLAASLEYSFPPPPTVPIAPTAASSFKKVHYLEEKGDWYRLTHLHLSPKLKPISKDNVGGIQ